MPRDSDSLILQLYARTPAPCRDYCGLTITRTEVVLNIWNITYGPHVFPKRQKLSLEEFPQDKCFQREVNRLFGEHVLEYVTSISKNERKLPNLPAKIFLHVLKYFAMKDVINLSQTSTIMFEVIYKCRKCFEQPPSQQDLIMADSLGWRDVLGQKIKPKEPKSYKYLDKMLAKAGFKSKEPHNNIKSSAIDTKKGLQKKLQSAIDFSNTQKQLEKSVGSSAKLINNKRALPNNTGNKLNLDQKEAGKMFEIIGKNTTTKSKTDLAKSSSALVNLKTSDLNNLKINQANSVVNLKHCATNPLQKTKNCLNLNNAKQNKNVDIRIDIPKMLEESAACNNIFGNSKNKNTTFEERHERC